MQNNHWYKKENKENIRWIKQTEKRGNRVYWLENESVKYEKRKVKLFLKNERKNFGRKCPSQNHSIIEKEKNFMKQEKAKAGGNLFEENITEMKE